MPLKTIDVPRMQGRVCYVTDEKGVPHATVECAVERQAYRVPWTSGRVDVGDWVSFEGQARVELVAGGGHRMVPYYHDPYDGSDRSEWVYYDLRNPEGLRRIGPLEAVEALRAARDALNLHLKAWYSNNSPERVRATLEALGAADDAMRKVLGEAEPARAAVVSVEV